MATNTSAATNGDRGDRLDWLSGRRLDAVVALISLWMIAGVFLDGRSHTRGAPETFFTLEHAIFYTAFLALTVVFGLVVYRERRSGKSYVASIPAEHRLSLLGVATFGLGGLADLAWHTAFGIETGIEALVSPTHYVLVAGALLLVSTPLRRAWREGLGEGWREQATPLLSATLVLSVLLFITVYANLLNGRFLVVPDFVAVEMGPVHATRVDEIIVERNFASVMVHTGIVMGLLLVLVRRFGDRLAPGFFTFALSLSGFGIAAFVGAFEFLPAMVLAGIAADILYWRLRPSLIRVRAVRLFATFVPVVLYAAFFGIHFLVRGMPWTVHVWTGAIVVAAASGYLLSLLVVSPTADQAVTVPADAVETR